MKNSLVLLLAFSLLSAQKCEKERGNACNTAGLVVDMSGLDGCGLMIELEDKSKLEPVEIFNEFELTEGMKISFDYEEVNGMSICMAGKQVKITCIDVIE
jgi:hypothetical protein